MALTQKEINDTIDVLNTQRAVLSQSDIDTLVQSLRDDGLDVVEENGNFVIKTTPAPLPPASGTEQQILQNMLENIRQLVALGKGGSGVDANEVNKLIEQYLQTEKVKQSDLAQDVLDLINATKKLEIKFPELESRKGKTIFPEPITSMILSDLMAQNNVYLYGGAGTGKSFIAEQIGQELLNCKVYTLPCNQYTSPLDLIGGQTIEGYQEGIVTRAYGNLDVPDDKDGALLLLDELPKLDPNTAGVLNDMLAKVKRGKPITNGRQEEIQKGKKIYIIATGNTKLNETNPNYTANFEQDRSLQDRFAGSCYEYIIELGSEKATMTGFLFIFNYLTKLRFEITDKNLDNVAFVSRRLMESCRDTHAFYMAQNKKKDDGSGFGKFPAKTVIQTLESFFSLFSPAQETDLKTSTNYDDFKKQSIEAMNRPETLEFVDTVEQVKEAEKLVAKFMKRQLDKYVYLKPFGA
jgi:cobaltochelatase CobS